MHSGTTCLIAQILTCQLFFIWLAEKVNPASILFDISDCMLHSDSPAFVSFLYDLCDQDIIIPHISSEKKRAIRGAETLKS